MVFGGGPLERDRLWELIGLPSYVVTEEWLWHGKPSETLVSWSFGFWLVLGLRSDSMPGLFRFVVKSTQEPASQSTETCNGPMNRSGFPRQQALSHQWLGDHQMHFGVIKRRPGSKGAFQLEVESTTILYPMTYYESQPIG